MDTLAGLQCRNAALEVELRLTKEQLVKAQEATVHLVNALTTHPRSPSYVDVNTCQTQLEELLAENAQLRRRIYDCSLHDTKEPLSRQTIKSSSHLTRAHAADDPFVNTPTPYWGNDVPHSRSKSVLSSSAGSIIPVVTEWLEQTPPSCSTLHIGSPMQAGRMLCSSIGLRPRHQASVTVAPNGSPILHPARDGQQCSNATCSRPPIRLGDQPYHSVVPEVASRDAHCLFTQSDRAYLLGLACFIEDLHDDEYAAKWMSINRRKGRFTAEAWQRFYEDTVRPIYLEQEARKVAAAIKSPQKVFKASDNATANFSKSQEDEHTDLGVKPIDSAMPVSGWDDRRVVHGDVQLIDLEDASGPDQKPYASSSSVRGSPAPYWALKRAAQDLDRDMMALRESSIDTPTADSLPLDMKNARVVLQQAHTQIMVGESAIGNANGAVSNPSENPTTKEEATLQAGQDGTSRIASRGARNPRCCQCPQNESDLYHSKFAAQHDPRSLRSVMIENVPPSLSLAEVLDKVRGGKIVSAVYLPLTEMRVTPAIETDAVLLTFMDAHRAKAYAEFCTAHAITFPHDATQTTVRAQVKLLPYPIRMPPAQIIGKMHRDELSRVLYLEGDSTLDASQIIGQAIAASQRSHGEVCRYPVRTGRDKDGIPFFEFPSIVDAMLAKAGLEKIAELTWCQRGFLPDPCDGPLGSLLEKSGSEGTRGILKRPLEVVYPIARPLIGAGLPAEGAAPGIDTLEMLIDGSGISLELKQTPTAASMTKKADVEVLHRKTPVDKLVAL